MKLHTIVSTALNDSSFVELNVFLDRTEAMNHVGRSMGGAFPLDEDFVPGAQFDSDEVDDAVEPDLIMTYLVVEI